MPSQAVFRKRYDLSQLPKTWKVFRVCVDWGGEPLLLIQEGKPTKPPRDAPIDDVVGWLNSPAKAHHAIYWEGRREQAITFEPSAGEFNHVQRFESGWLLSESRGLSGIYEGSGRFRHTVDLGDASNDVQATPGGRIWVSYFDEGVYGNDLGSQQGLLCFNSEGQQLFKYFDFAEQNSLPFIDDCYAINVVNEDEVWLSYYSAFPLVCIKNFQLHRVWRDFGCMRAFAFTGDGLIFAKCYEDAQLLKRSLGDQTHAELLEAIDERGQAIRSFQVAARGSRMYLWTETAVYEMD